MRLFRHVSHALDVYFLLVLAAALDARRAWAGMRSPEEASEAGIASVPEKMAGRSYTTEMC